MPPTTWRCKRPSPPWCRKILKNTKNIMWLYAWLITLWFDEIKPFHAFYISPLAVFCSLIEQFPRQKYSDSQATGQSSGDYDCTPKDCPCIQSVLSCRRSKYGLRRGKSPFLSAKKNHFRRFYWTECCSKGQIKLYWKLHFWLDPPFKWITVWGNKERFNKMLSQLKSANCVMIFRTKMCYT